MLCRQPDLRLRESHISLCKQKTSHMFVRKNRIDWIQERDRLLYVTNCHQNTDHVTRVVEQTENFR